MAEVISKNSGTEPATMAGKSFNAGRTKISAEETEKMEIKLIKKNSEFDIETSNSTYLHTLLSSHQV